MYLIHCKANPYRINGFFDWNPTQARIADQ